MKAFKDPATGEKFTVGLVSGPGMGSTLSLHPSARGLSRHLFVPPNKTAEARRVYNRPHRPEMLIAFAEGLRSLPERVSLRIVDEASEVTEEMWDMAGSFSA